MTCQHATVDSKMNSLELVTLAAIRRESKDNVEPLHMLALP